MSDSLKYKIFIETECPSEQTMFDYIDKKLNAKESHHFEKHLLSCELCSDALEGLELTQNRDRIAAINQKINELLAIPQKETREIVFYYKLIASIAATVLLLLGGVFLFYQFNQKEDLAELKSESAIPLVVPPAPPPPPVVEKISDQVNTAVQEISKAPKTSSNEETDELRANLSSNKKKEKDQSAAFEKEEPVSQQDYKTSIASGAGATITDNDTRRPLTQTEENLTGIYLSPEQQAHDAPKKEYYQLAKDDIKLDEMEKAAEPGAIEGNENLKLAEVTSTKALAATPAEDKKERGGANDEGAKKSAKNYNMARSEAKEKKHAEKGNAGADASGDYAYAPQSLMANDADLEMATSTSGSNQGPEFPGGQDSLKLFIRKNFNYPENFREQTNTGSKIYVTFIVDKNGVIKKAKILKGINSELDKEALRVINMMPKWKPGSTKGEITSQQVDLPIQLE